MLPAAAGSGSLLILGHKIHRNRPIGDFGEIERDPHPVAGRGPPIIIKDNIAHVGALFVGGKAACKACDNTA